MSSISEGHTPAGSQGPAIDPTTRRRGRSVVACINCNKRKVRCTVALSGPPCANCVHDRVECRVPPRKTKTTPRRLSRSLRPSRPEVIANTPSSSAASQYTSSLTTPLEQNLPELENQLWRSELPTQITERVATSEISPVMETPTGKGDSWRPDDCDEGENSAAYAVALEDNVADKDSAPFYVGDQQGLRFVVDICRPDRTSKGNHFLVPRTATKSQPGEVLALLCMQGVFSLPTADVCRNLFRCYFYYVHPFLPIIDASSFIKQYLSGDLQRGNLLLLWSMFFAAANFIDNDGCKAAGFSSRKAMKRSMYRKAKSLYDVDYEKDKISLIQSVILMGFWYADTEDRTGSWHWIGVAISLCQTIGLHRDTERDQALRQSTSNSKGPLWRRIWWTCYCRDAWLSLGMGRPMRINIDDCDTPFPSTDDYLANLTDIPTEDKDQFLPEHSQQLALYWVTFLKMSMALGNILSTHYRPPKKATPTIDQIETNEREILECAKYCLDDSQPLSKVVEVHLYHLQLYYEAVKISLYRPYVINGVAGLDPEKQEAWRLRALRKASQSASSANAVLNKFITADLVHLCQAVLVTALIPTLQIHLLEATSSNVLGRRLAQNQLDICMIVMGELRKTYWAADFLHRLFSKVQNKLEARKEKPATATETELEFSKPMTPDSTVYTKESGIPEDFLYDDILLSNDYLSNRWNPFLCYTNEAESNASMDLDLEINSLFNQDDLDDMWRCNDNVNNIT